VSDTTMGDTIAHYRVNMGHHWLHAVAMGDAMAVLKRLKEDDPVWQRPDVELVACKPIDAWNGPFPKPGKMRIWTVGADD
jgi:hypothetical protein